MATRTVSSGDFIRPYRRVKTEVLKEGASSTFKMGDPLIRSSVSGYEGDHVIIAGTDPQTLIYGFAAQDASGVTGTPISVWVASPEAEFRGVVEADKALDGTMVGAAYELVADSTNSIYRVDTSSTAKPITQITKLLDADGDVNGYVAFRIRQVTTANQTIY